MKAASFVAVTLVCAAFSAVPAAAQLGYGAGAVRSDTRGLGIGLQLNGTGVESGSASGRVPGAGLGVTLSYGMTDALSVFGRANTGYRMSQVDLGARYRFGSPTGALRPYVEGAVTRLGAVRNSEETDQSLRSWGTGTTVGAGVEYHFSRRFAVDLGVTHTRGRYSPAPGDEGFRQKFTSDRVQMGFTWRP
jgi:opacity protein-like surface antigen